MEIQDRLYTPLYRICLAITMLFLKYHQKGVTHGSNPKKIHNDMTDAYIAAQATFTHGIISEDKGFCFLVDHIAEALRWQGVELPQDDFE